MESIMKKYVLGAAFCLLTLPFTACAGISAQKAAPAAPLKQEDTKKRAETDTADKTRTHLLGGISPEEALEYMKRTPNLVMVEVNAPEWKRKEGFTGALWIPYTEMPQRHHEIPKGRPVLLHCGGGIVSKMPARHGRKNARIFPKWAILLVHPLYGPATNG